MNNSCWRIGWSTGWHEDDRVSMAAAAAIMADGGNIWTCGASCCAICDGTRRNAGAAEQCDAEKCK